MCWYVTSHPGQLGLYMELWIDTVSPGESFAVNSLMHSESVVSHMISCCQDED